ncbi:MAG: 4Fe-4S binding protein [Ruminococcus sp.]
MKVGVNMTKEIPVLYSKKEECCGCTACYSVCPQSAISMVADE